MEPVFEFLQSNLGSVLLSGLSIGLSFLVLKLLPYMDKLSEIRDVINAVFDAVEDGTITKSELEIIVKEIKDVVG